METQNTIRERGHQRPHHGLAAGVVGGTTSFVGPLLVLYLSSLENLKKDDFVKRRTTVLGGFLPMYGGLALLDRSAGRFSVRLQSVSYADRIWLGERMRFKVSEALFERAVMITLGLIALSLFIDPH